MQEYLELAVVKESLFGNMHPSRASQLIVAYNVTLVLDPEDPLPANDSFLRPLVSLSSARQRRVWSQAVVLGEAGRETMCRGLVERLVSSLPPSISKTTSETILEDLWDYGRGLHTADLWHYSRLFQIVK